MDLEYSNFICRKKKKIIKLKVILPNLILLLLLLYFLYYTINGSNGFLTLIKLNEELSNVHKIYDNLAQEKKFLQIKNNGLYIKSLDLDILEEESKKILGYAEVNEIILITDNEE